MVAAHGIARSGALRRQFLAMAVLIVAQLAVVVGLMTAAMFVEANFAILNQRLLTDKPAPVEEDAKLISEVFLRGLSTEKRRSAK